MTKRPSILAIFGHYYTTGPRSIGHALQELYGTSLFRFSFMTILLVIQNNLDHCISFRTFLVLVYDILGDFLVLVYDNIGSYPK